jgi:quercetin dioxygenase-like cupin family protein
MANDENTSLEGVQQVNWNDVPVEQMNDLLTRQYIYGEKSMLARIELKKGCIVPSHRHANEQISYIAEGALRFLLGEPGSEIEKIARKGDVMVMPGGVPHSAEALEDTINFDLFAPPRQDWIDKDDSYMR